MRRDQLSPRDLPRDDSDQSIPETRPVTATPTHATPRAYRAHPAITKAVFVAEMQAHAVADRLVQGTYAEYDNDGDTTAPA